MRIYHASKKIITTPVSAHKNLIRDFGDGFYATENEELVMEWASIDDNGGFINIFELETDQLNVLDLGSPGHSVLNWLALILSGRSSVADSQNARRNAEGIIKRYLPDISSVDIIKGFRADDTNLIYCKAFIEERIDKDQLSALIESADLGEQLVLCSEKAFDSLKYISSEAIDGSYSYHSRLTKELRALRLLEKLTDKAPLSSSAAGPRAPYPQICLKYSADLLGRLTAHVQAVNASVPGLSAGLFLSCFIVSGIASRFEAGDPYIILGNTYYELYQRILLSCGLQPSSGIMEDAGQDSSVPYWCGSMLAFYQWYKNIPFADILSSLSYGRLFALYPELHDLPFKEACDAIDSRLDRRRSASTRLQAYRKRFGLSQRELA
ncbi:MAG: DUF3990 domain-containing protein, partial [Lachnospiraceae bacterium]|nr:DUF3990 domain-containing protein [Lachnospiraceae bacterium]